MKAYKGFDKNLRCRGFQYKVGQEYETDSAKLCERGFHACEAPLKVWDFYPPVDGNRFCEVEQDGSVQNEGADGKSVATKIKIGAEIGIHGLVKAHVEWCKAQTKGATESRNVASGGYAKIGSSGDSAQIGSSGDSAKIGSKRRLREDRQQRRLRADRQQRRLRADRQQRRLREDRQQRRLRADRQQRRLREDQV